MSNDATRVLIERGELVPDSLVGEVVLEVLLVQSCQVPECGILVDGFPRTALQVCPARVRGGFWASGASGGVLRAAPGPGLECCRV